jgi:RNA polymerase sigma-70 factor, ECF subfamily
VSGCSAFGCGPASDSRSAIVDPGERELVARAQAGDADATAELLRTHAPRVYRMLARLLADPAGAEDVLQEVLVKAWRALPRFRGDARFSTWLYRIALNEAALDRRQRARQVPLEATPLDDVGHELAAPDADPAGAAATRDFLAFLERCVMELPPHYRAAVVLRDVEGFSNREAARLLGLDLHNFKSRLHRGRMTIRDRVAGAYEL